MSLELFSGWLTRPWRSRRRPPVPSTPQARTRRLLVEGLEERGNPSVTVTENFDGVTQPNLPPGWTATFDPTQPSTPTPWRTRTTGFGSPAPTSPNFVFASDAPAQTDNFLTSPTISISGINPKIAFQ